MLNLVLHIMLMQSASMKPTPPHILESTRDMTTKTPTNSDIKVLWLLFEEYSWKLSVARRLTKNIDDEFEM